MTQRTGEKRKFRRFRLPVAHYEGRDDKKIHGVSDVLDVSREGFRILSDEPIKKGTVLECKINVPDILDIQCQGKVRWSATVEGYHFEGLQFSWVDPGDKAELLEYAYRMWVAEEKAKRIR
ncbi:MAG: PilZ domain-containing protein [Candidatus Omnitrophica bacterium]|nr:PilZ domain-containing protein [Candidatus Omnitrophota bacterium]